MYCVISRKKKFNLMLFHIIHYFLVDIESHNYQNRPNLDSCLMWNSREQQSILVSQFEKSGFSHFVQQWSRIWENCLNGLLEMLRPKTIPSTCRWFFDAPWREDSAAQTTDEQRSTGRSQLTWCEYQTEGHHRKTFDSTTLLSLALVEQLSPVLQETLLHCIPGDF